MVQFLLAKCCRNNGDTNIGVAMTNSSTAAAAFGCGQLKSRGFVRRAFMVSHHTVAYYLVALLTYSCDWPVVHQDKMAGHPQTQHCTAVCAAMSRSIAQVLRH
jgi:hypothetical protein